MLKAINLLSALAIFGVVFKTILSAQNNMMSTLESGSLEFGLKLDKLLSSDTQNVVFSPFSLSTALAMTLLGAHNESGEELSNILFGKVIRSDEYQSVAKEYQILVDRCLKSNEKVLSSANFLYSHKNYPILQNYKQLIESSFGAKSRELDFISRNKEAVDAINKDISEATKGKIPKLFDQIDVNTRMVLANALYFKGLWSSQFKKEFTTTRKFTTTDKKEIDVQMMYQKSKFPFGYSEALKSFAVQLPYKESNVALLVLLPEETSTLFDLKSKLNGHTLDQLLKQMYPNKVDLYLPKFKIESTFPLIPFLNKVGIHHIFDSKSANFSGITNDSTGLYVGDVIQKAIIEVNEEGTEAAAATGVSFLARSLDLLERFEANRPFMFLLISKYDSNKNMVLFTGTVNNPNA